MSSLSLTDCLLSILCLDRRQHLSAHELTESARCIAATYRDELAPECLAFLREAPDVVQPCIAQAAEQLVADGLALRDECGRYSLTSAGVILAQAPCGQLSPALLDHISM